MNQHVQGRRILESAGMFRFAPVSDHDYDAIREMDRVAGAALRKANHLQAIE
jgi:hypothetical protein